MKKRLNKKQKIYTNRDNLSKIYGCKITIVFVSELD